MIKWSTNTRELMHSCIAWSWETCKGDNLWRVLVRNLVVADTVGSRKTQNVEWRFGVKPSVSSFSNSYSRVKSHLFYLVNGSFLWDFLVISLLFQGTWIMFTSYGNTSLLVFFSFHLIYFHLKVTERDSWDRNSWNNDVNVLQFYLRAL